ncbi:MAG: tetratricopeptide repeat protein [Myxococcales bacterium]|nr:tetratricopeptide repeat protein [Myxococcales bacterium]
MTTPRPLLVLAAALTASACTPHIQVKYQVPAALHFGDAVQQVYVTHTIGDADVLTVLDPLAALVRTVVAPDVARHLEQQLMQAQLYAVYPECPAPCPSADTRFEVELDSSNVNRGTLASKSANGTDTTAKVSVKVRVLNRDGTTRFADSYTGSTNAGVPKPDQSAPSDEALIRAAAFNAVDSFVQDLRPSVGSVMFALKAEGPLEAGVDLAMNGDLDGAWNYFRELLQKDPGNAAALYDLGVVMTAKGELELALDAFKAAAALNPEYADDAAGAERRISNRAALRAQQGR